MCQFTLGHSRTSTLYSELTRSICQACVSHAKPANTPGRMCVSGGLFTRFGCLINFVRLEKIAMFGRSDSDTYGSFTCIFSGTCIYQQPAVNPNYNDVISYQAVLR